MEFPQARQLMAVKHCVPGLQDEGEIHYLFQIPGGKAYALAPNSANSFTILVPRHARGSSAEILVNFTGATDDLLFLHYAESLLRRNFMQQYSVSIGAEKLVIPIFKMGS